MQGLLVHDLKLSSLYFHCSGSIDEKTHTHTYQGGVNITISKTQCFKEHFIDCSVTVQTFFNTNSIATWLKKYFQWSLWNLEPQPEGKQKRNGYQADFINSETWRNFEEAFSGHGFIFTREDSFIFFDWDNAKNPTNGEVIQISWKKLLAYFITLKFPKVALDFSKLQSEPQLNQGINTGFEIIQASKQIFN